MKRIYIIAFFLTLAFLACEEDTSKDTAITNEPRIKKEEPNWEFAFKVSDLPQPESVAFDKARNVLYVSNQNQEKEGFISVIHIDGTVVEKEWVKGLVNPKGIEIVGDKLFVSDETVLVEIDIKKAEIIKKHIGENAKFLNDVASDANGNVYVSDMHTSAIYRLDLENNFMNWLQTPELEFPNGLLVKDNHLYIGAWGSTIDEKQQKGNVLKVSLSDKKITKLSDEGIGNLDGLQNYQGGFLLSDWMNGNIYTFSAGKAQKIIETTRGSGDIAYLAEQGRIYIPMALEDEVLVYQMAK